MNYILKVGVLALGLAALAPISVLAAGSETGAVGETAAAGVDLAPVRAMLDGGDFAGAFDALAVLAKGAGKDNADVWNLLGYASRKLQHWDDSAEYYAAALKIDPDHLGALEYQGELFLQTGKPEAAKANLDKLQGLCGTCEEYQELAAALASSGS